MKAPIHWTLFILERAKPYALPESALRVEVNAHLRPPLVEKEYRALLEDLERDQFIGRKEDKHDDEPRWFVREAGEVALDR